MPYRNGGYDLHYLRDFKPRPPKTWEQLERDAWRTHKKYLQRIAREEQAALEHEELEKARAVARQARSARLAARNYQPEPSPEPEWVIAPRVSKPEPSPEPPWVTAP